MKKLIAMTLFLSGCTVLAPLQKSKLISVFHLIETAEYKEAKTLIEEMTDDEESSQWVNTWYARGLLCQAAYKEGLRKNDKKLYELYPGQLYVAYESYEKARSLDKQGKIDRQLAPKYVVLANDLQESGVKHFNSKNYKEALKAFWHALMITESPLLSFETDTSLLYNAALSAYESKDWPKAIELLTRLHDAGYSANATHLLFEAYLETEDEISAETVLTEGIDRYIDNESLILLLSGFLYENNDAGRALETLEKAIAKNPSGYQLRYTKGLLHQKNEEYKMAINAYEKAIKLAPDEIMPYLNIATCYYNIGVAIEENTRTLTDNFTVRKEKEKSAEAFDSAITWLDKAYNKEPVDQNITSKIYELYKQLRIDDKVKNME